MFKKRLAGNKRTFKASEMDEKEGAETESKPEEAEQPVIKPPTVSFKKRKITDKLNSVSTKL